MSCLYAICTAAARSAAQSDRSTSPLILCGYWYAGQPIRGPIYKRLGLSLPRVLTNQMLDLHEAGDNNNLLKTKSRHLIGRDTHIMLFKVPIMLCSNSQHQANYAHCFVPIMLSVLSIFSILILISFGNLYLMKALFHRKDKLWPY